MEVEILDQNSVSFPLTFYKQNRKGKPLKICREKYLRDDINCGVVDCKTCPVTKRAFYKLDPKPPIYSLKFNYMHYLLPDAAFILRQIDVLEEFENVILLQVVMEEVCRLSTFKYRRLRDGLKNRKFFYFLNEHSRETYIARNPRETVEDRNRRAFAKCYSHFTNHFGNKGVKLVALSDDPKFLDNHKFEEYPLTMTVTNGTEYVENMTEKYSTLEDKLCRVPFEDDETLKRFGDSIYPPHLEMSLIQDGIKGGKYLQGAYRSMNFYEGNVRVDADMEVLIQGLSSINRSTDGDIVAIELLKEESLASGMVIVDQDDETPLTSEPVVTGDEVEEELLNLIQETNKNAENAERKQKTGKVVGIIRRKWQPCCGILKRSQMTGGNQHYFWPDNKRIPRVKIESRNIDRLERKKILIQIDHWPANSRFPVGHFLKLLGEAGTIETETEAILYEHGIPHEPFSKAVESDLPTLPYQIPEEEYAHRRDMRDILVLSVDPPGCTDIDDALHCTINSDGTYEVGVHIADVSYYVKVDTALDEEAAKRGTTVYLADKRIDMIPTVLSSNIASLHPGIDKLVFSVIWKMSKDANILETNFYKGVIKSKGALTYDEAQAKLNTEAKDDVTTSLKRLSFLAQILKKRRFDNGALMLSSEVSSDADINTIDSEESHSMVEEFMLLANCSVAEYTLNSFTEYSLLRRHPIPPPANFKPLLLAAEAQGLTIIVDKGSKILNETLENQPEEVKNILRVLTTRCMTQALYCCSGTSSPEEYLHFGLAVKLYTHFTSPIRRYADLMVHRLLAIAIQVKEVDPRVLDSKRIHEICENINVRHRMAQYASRASYNIHKSKLLKGKKEQHDGYVLFVRRNALHVFVPKYAMEGFIFYPKEMNYNFNEKEISVTFPNNVKMRSLDKVIVMISLEEDKDKVQFELVSPNIPGLSINI